MKKILFISAAFVCLNATAQTPEEGNAKDQAGKMSAKRENKVEGWTKGGTLNLNFGEGGVNDAWKNSGKGGETQTITIRGIVDYDFNKKSGKNLFFNNVRARYALAKVSSGGDQLNKVDDYLSITSQYAKEINSKWGIGALVNVETQFDRFFLSPGNIKFGPGITYNPNKHFSAFFSPAMGNLATRLATEHRDLPTGKYGVDSGKTVKLGLGAFLQLKADYEIAKGINYKGFATLYSNYMNQPGSIALDWTNLFTLTVNKYIGATISINVRNNDFEASGTQIQRSLGIGFSYKL